MSGKWLPWTLPEAVTFITKLKPELVLVGYYPGLTGSLLYSGGFSPKDLDLIVYPTCTHDSPPIERVKDVFQTFGMRLEFTRELIQSSWRKSSSLDEKYVEGWSYQNKRVDVFFLR